MLRLNYQYENHPYVEEFTRECCGVFVYRTYVLEGEADATFSLAVVWNLFQKDALPNNSGSFCRQMINCMRAWNYLQKTLDLPLSTEIIKQAHDLMIEDEKDVLVGEYKKYLQAIIFLHQRVILKDTWKTQFLGFMRLRWSNYGCYKFVREYDQYTSIWRLKWKNMSLDFSSCLDTDEISSISSHFKLLL